MLTVKLNPLQERFIKVFSLFLEDTKPIFILRGSAGTGKTTLIEGVIDVLNARNHRYAALAPTGRAARILGAKTRSSTSTIHREIYVLSDIEIFEQAQTSNDPGIRFVYPLKQDDPRNTIFIVDEASMVGDRESKGDVLQFGSGRLLADLINFARLGRPGRNGERGAKILFVGDPAQLPPIGEVLSPALSANYLKETFGLYCEEYVLTEVMRQASGSAILNCATKLRDLIGKREFNTFDLSSAGDEIVAVSIPDAVSQVEAAYRAKSSSVLITHTNAQALDLNRAVRGRLWGDEKASLHVGDVLLVNKNSAATGLLNGDLVKAVDVSSKVEIRRVYIKGVVQPVELVFRMVSFIYRDADGQTDYVDCRILENLLDSPISNISPVEQRALLVDFRQRYPDLKPKSAEFRMTIRHDPYFNALLVKYGYALTCHKAQGGEWDTAVVNFSDGRGKDNEEFFRWTYTAITRAKKNLLTVNAPKFDPWPPPFREPSPMPDDPLFAFHKALCDAWAPASIVVERLDHLQYCERYTLSRAGKHAAVQYHYKKNHEISTVVAVPGTASDLILLDDTLALMKQVLINVHPLTDPFLVKFREKVASSLVKSEIRLVSVVPMQYRLRMVFEEKNCHARIDFIYDGKKMWTHIEEVDGLGSSHGIIEQLHKLLEQCT